MHLVFSAFLVALCILFLHAKCLSWTHVWAGLGEGSGLLSTRRPAVWQEGGRPPHAIPAPCCQRPRARSRWANLGLREPLSPARRAAGAAALSPAVPAPAQPCQPVAPELPENCQQPFLEGQQSSGVFQVQPSGSQPFKVYCDMTAEGGWTVIQRRRDGSVDFDQLWDAYKNGFGDLHGDFWLGLEKIHHLVQEGRYNLLIELEDWEGNSQVVQFVFSLGGESTAYTLNLLGPLSGELENAIGDFRQLPFSTRDRDHDLKADTNCAKHLSGGWWFSTCGHANLNGKYFRSIPRQRHERKQGIFWKTWKGRYYPLKSTTMKIRPTELEAEP
uniref:Angiopoietin like 4 n=1 Tax=Apteryx owenii TaxID=8824 RepID=A0A8B9Q772_APTOW